MKLDGYTIYIPIKQPLLCHKVTESNFGFISPTLLPYNAHRYLIKTMLICRYIKFIKSIRKSPKLAVQYLYQKIQKNINTVTGKNIDFVLKETGDDSIEDIDTIKVKKQMKFCEAEESGWKSDFIKEIVILKHKVLTLNNGVEDLFDKE